MFRVFVGSTRRAKIDATIAALQTIAVVDDRFSPTAIEPIDVTDVAPTMPMTERAILEGALVRARTLLERHGPTAGGEVPLALGVEGGLDPLPLADPSDRFVLKTWAVASDGRRWGYGAGGAIVLPESVTREVLAGRELGDVIDEVARAAVRSTRGTWGVLTRDLIGRRDSFTSAILAALAPFYNAALYD
jgi:non-canonical (house-cleaning) NTP pyrophosphatase